MVIGGSVVTYREMPAYVGPGDIVSGAEIWAGLRAYSNATAGTNAVRLRRSSDNAEQDFVTLTNGSLDVASITSFKGAANLFVVKLYDQTGNGFDLVQTTAANQPSFTLSGLGSLPIMTFNGSTHRMDTASTVTSTQPFTWSVISKTTTTSTGAIISAGGGAILQHPFGSGTLYSAYAGNHLNTAAGADTNWHAAQSVFNGASSVLAVDGVEATGDPGSSNPSGNVLTIGTDVFAEFFTGSAVEWGLWDSGFSSGDRSAMNSNQSTYWGF